MDVFGGLAVVLGAAAVGGIVARLLRQPAILGYICVGVLLSTLGVVARPGFGPLLELLGKLGVTLLLFLVGLELPLGQLKQIGKPALVVGLGQVALSALGGYGLGRVFGLGPATALFLGVALSFSSTIIAVRLLIEKRDVESLYGKVSVGVLLVQDFIAVGLLIFLSGTQADGWGWAQLATVVAKGLVMVGVTVWLSGKVLPRVLNWLGESSELLFIGTLSWCLVVASLAATPGVGLGLETGGFLAGLALSGTAQHLQIGARIRPLRDFFLTWFFVSLGAGFQVRSFPSLVLPAVVLAAFVLLGRPVMVMTLMGLLGYRRRNAFLTGVTLAHISEFSLVIMSLLVARGYVGRSVLALTALVGAMTMMVSTYVIGAADQLYRKLSRYLGIFEKRMSSEPRVAKALSGHVVLFGHNRTGGALRPVLDKLGLKVVVVDFNPEVVEELKKQGVDVVYGDLSDYEVYADLGLPSARLVISTVSDVSDNLQFLEYLGSCKPAPAVIVMAQDSRQALRLYAAGADYVLVPHAVGGEYLGHLLSTAGAVDKEKIAQYGQKHRRKLETQDL